MRKQLRMKLVLQAKHALLAASAYLLIISIDLSDVESILQTPTLLYCLLDASWRLSFVSLQCEGNQRVLMGDVQDQL